MTQDEAERAVLDELDRILGPQMRRVRRTAEDYLTAFREVKGDHGAMIDLLAESLADLVRAPAGVKAPIALGLLTIAPECPNTLTLYACADAAHVLFQSCSNDVHGILVRCGLDALRKSETH